MPGRAAGGFTIIGLMVVVAVINIGLAVATTSWIAIDQRAKEAELIWRGQQYVRALRCHQQEAGALPDQLDELLDSGCARALYPDPMSPDGRWRLIRRSDLEPEVERSTASDAAVRLDAIDREVRGPEAFAERVESLRPAAEARTGRSLGGLSFGADRRLGAGLRASAPGGSALGGPGAGNGIVGVVSSSTRRSLRIYDGETSYDGWRFVLR